MSRNKNNQEFVNLFFKPVVIKTDIEEKFAMIYSYNSIVEHILDDDGNVVKSNKDIVKYLDITRTIALGASIVDSIVVHDRKKFLDSLVEVPVAQCFQDIIHATSILIEELGSLNEKQIDIRNIIAAVKKAASSLNVNNLSQGNIILAGSNEPLAHIVFKTITGDKIDITKNLSPQDVATLGGVLLDIIRNHADEDMDNVNEEFLKKLRAEVEYKIVESLPTSIKAGDIHINMEAFVDEIKRFRETNNEEESE